MRNISIRYFRYSIVMKADLVGSCLKMSEKINIEIYNHESLYRIAIHL